MRTLAGILVAVLLAAGCGHSQVRISNTGDLGALPPPRGGGLSVQVHDSSLVRAVAVFAALGALFRAGLDEARRWVPPLAEGRRIHEQDCTRPIEDETANLRCR